MLDLNDFYFFVQVVEHRGFAAASRALELPKSTLSRHVLSLEARLGARLIQRTSRKFAVTEAGREIYRHGVAMLVQAESAENAIRQRLGKASGAVRVTCSVNMAQLQLAALLPRFMGDHPDVDVLVHATNRVVDVVEEGFDVALRGHVEALPPSTFEQRVVARTPWALVAAPSYLDRAAAISDPADLGRHPALVYGGPPWSPVWKLRREGGGDARVMVRARLASDDMVELREAARAGLGVTALPGYLCRSAIEEGTLRRVLPEWSAGDGVITLIVPSTRGALPAVRAFADYVVANFASATS